MQRVSSTPENAVRLQLGYDKIDVREMASTLNIPTLVVHLKDDRCTPFEEGRLTAAHIPGARFVPLEGNNHVILPTVPG